MSVSDQAIAPARSSVAPWTWAIAFSVAMPAVAVANANELLAEPWRSIVSLAALSLVVPMTVSSLRYRRVEGETPGPVLRAYNRRIAIALALYTVVALIAFTNYDRLAPGSALMWLAALAPTVPLLGMIWALFRYVTDETDEFLRHQAVMAALVGLALVLVVATLWGFLETFGLVPHVWNWWVFPGWAIGLAIGQLWMKVRGQ
jgi:hypothetical protein